MCPTGPVTPSKLTVISVKYNYLYTIFYIITCSEERKKVVDGEVEKIYRIVNTRVDTPYNTKEDRLRNDHEE